MSDGNNKLSDNSFFEVLTLLAGICIIISLANFIDKINARGACLLREIRYVVQKCTAGSSVLLLRPRI